MSNIDPDHARFTIPNEVVALTADLLSESGKRGLEGSVLWIGHVNNDTDAEVTKACRPEQIAHATPMGLSVALTEEGLTEVIRTLTGDEIVLARIHTHGNHHVDHSEIDNRNLVVAHPGAVSIVVPYFAKHGMDLSRCGVHILSYSCRWVRLSVAETDERFEVK